MTKFKPQISPPGIKVFGTHSPVVKAAEWIRHFLSGSPEPDIGTKSAKSNAMLVGNHLLSLIAGCGLLNGSGLHSAAVTLLRPLEDALDCFAAVTLVKGAAEQWENGQLKPSDAAKQWTMKLGHAIQPKDNINNITISEYRKYLRRQFNKYSHCSHNLCLWDLFFNPQSRNDKTGVMQGTLDLNFKAYVIDSNAHSIDAHLTAHLLEFIELINQAYSGTLQSQLSEFNQLLVLRTQITEIMDKHNEHRCQEVRIPPEVARLKNN